MIAETSREAYEKIKAKLNQKQGVVYGTLEAMGSATNDELAYELGWPIQSVTGRVSELKYKGMVTCVGIGKSRYGNSAKIWGIIHPNDHNLRNIR